MSDQLERRLRKGRSCWVIEDRQAYDEHELTPSAPRYWSGCEWTKDTQLAAHYASDEIARGTLKVMFGFGKTDDIIPDGIRIGHQITYDWEAISALAKIQTKLDLLALTTTHQQTVINNLDTAVEALRHYGRNQGMKT